MPGTSDSQFLKQFGENLRRLRTERNLTMQQLANKAEIELSQIYRIEKGIINPKLSTIVILAGALEVSPKDLF